MLLENARQQSATCLSDMFEDWNQCQNMQSSLLTVLEASRNIIISNLTIDGVYRCQNHVMQVFFNLFGQ